MFKGQERNGKEVNAHAASVPFLVRGCLKLQCSLGKRRPQYSLCAQPPGWARVASVWCAASVVRRVGTNLPSLGRLG